MSEQKQERLPIGYWLKRADELLTARIDEAQRANGVTRLEWQALNVIRQSPLVARDDIAGALRPFADVTETDELLGRLTQRGVVAATPEGWVELTQAGTELYETASASQTVVRQRAMVGISAAEYQTTVEVLRRLVENLEHNNPA